MYNHSLLYTHKAWQFDDVAIECLVADMEREDLVELCIKEPFFGEPGRQRTAFAAARTRNRLLRSGESVFRRLAAARRQLRGSPLISCLPLHLLVAICQALSVYRRLWYNSLR
ncbi:hypothetical protein ISCGN_011817 [Ixodes scapularis]